MNFENSASPHCFFCLSQGACALCHVGSYMPLNKIKANVNNDILLTLSITLILPYFNYRNIIRASCNYLFILIDSS